MGHRKTESVRGKDLGRELLVRVPLLYYCNALIFTIVSTIIPTEYGTSIVCDLPIFDGQFKIC